tara:strand:- start:859 stop:1788 length:930 start_codon:yes stop_codon:yes gene_type:complete
MNKKKTFPKKKTTEDVAVATETIVATPAEENFKVPPMPKKSNPFVSPSFGRKSEKPTLYRLTGGKRIKGTNKRQFPVVYMMRAEDIIYDPIKSVNRKIRYIPGESSIYEDEQKEDAKVKSPIIFTEGVLAVNHQNPTLKNFLDNCNANKSNPNRMKDKRIAFEMVDKASTAKQMLNKEMKEMDAMNLALKMPISRLIGYAKVLGVNVDKSTEEIRYDMKVLAKKAPSSFIAGLDDPMTEIKETILNAEDYGIVSMQSNRISWKRGDELSLICHVPVGVKALDHFSGYCLQDEGQLVLEEMKKQIAKFNN